MRLSTPRSRRKTMLYASAVNVVDITLIPAIEGTSLFRSCWLPLRIAPPAARNSSGSAKLKNAALGLRQNILRSRRYWRQLKGSASGIPVPGRCGGQLQIDVLERRAPHRQLLQAPSFRQRLAGQLVQQRRRVLRLELHEIAGRVAIGDLVAQPAEPARLVAPTDAELPRRPDREYPPVLDDRHTICERLRLLQVVRRQEDRLAQRA